MNSKIKDRRIELGLTLEEVGDICGVGKSTVRKWENGMINDIGRSKIVLLAKALQVSPLFILENDIETRPLDKGELKLLEKYNVLNGPGKQEAVNRVTELTYIPQYVNAKNDIAPLHKEKKKYIPTEEDIQSLVARNGKKFTREEAIEFISEMLSDDEDE